MKALMKLDRPETWLAIHGYLIAFLWEMLQMPYYAMSHLSAWETTINCSLASLGDAGIMVFAYFVASWTVNDRHWLSSRNRKPVIAFLVTGLVITLVVEHFATGAAWGWRYSARMPTLLGIGIVPIVMWIVVPLIALGLASRSVAHRIER